MTSSNRSPASSDGFSLVEMLVATAISAIVVMAGVALLMGQQRMYQSSSGERGLQETARMALGELMTTVRVAGFGVDPPLAIDFGFADNVNMAQAPRVPGVPVRTSPYKCAAPILCRDSVVGPDELVFYARNPVFGHTITAVNSSTSISISGPLNVPLYKGQILQLMCDAGSMYWAYVTVDAYVPPSAGPAPVPVALSVGPGGNLLDFPYQQGVLSGPYSGCFTSGLAMVAKVDRYRYYIETYGPTGVVQPAQTPGSRPYLTLDQGLTGQDGNAITTMITPDVEDLQVSYLYPLGAVPVVGATPGAAIAVGATGIDLAAATGNPGYGTPLTDSNGIATPSRLNQQPSNIRGVRVSLVVRSATADPAIIDNSVLASGNRPASPGLPNYRRMRIESSIMMPNMDARAPYFPFLSTNNGADRLNVGGG